MSKEKTGEIRKQIARLKHDNFGCGGNLSNPKRCPHWQKDCFNCDWVVIEGLCPEMIDQILALIKANIDQLAGEAGTEREGREKN